MIVSLYHSIIDPLIVRPKLQ